MAKTPPQKTKSAPNKPVSFHLETHWARMQAIRDGDTVVVELTRRKFFVPFRETKVLRLAGINTSELNTRSPNDPEPFAIEATRYVQQFLPIGKRILVTYAVKKKTNQPRCDRFGRLLAFIHLPVCGWFKGRCVNVALVRRGLARLYEHPDWMTPAYQTQLSLANQEARRKHRGIHGKQVATTQQGLTWLKLQWIGYGVVLGVVLAVVLKLAFRL